MEKITDLISKQVVSLSQGRKIGYILDAVFDEEARRLLGFIVIDEESENDMFLPIKKIKGKGDAVTVESQQCCEILLNEKENSLLGKNVLDEYGVSYGKVKEVGCALSVVKKIWTEKAEIFPSMIRSVGKDFVVLGKRKKDNKRPTFKDITKEKLPSVFIQNEANLISENRFVAGCSAVISAPEMPARIVANSLSVIGKKAVVDIFGYNNEIIIKKGEKISKNIINKAIKHNKLNFLIFNCE